MRKPARGNVRNTAWMFMLAATAVYAFLPLTFEHFGTINAPILAAGLIEVVSSFVIFGYLYYIIKRSETLEAYKPAREVWDTYKAKRFRAFKSGYTWLITIGQMQWLMFLLSAQFIDTAVATILYEMRPVWFVLVMAFTPTIIHVTTKYSERFNTATTSPTNKNKNDSEEQKYSHTTYNHTTYNHKITIDRFIFVIVGFGGLMLIVISQTEPFRSQQQPNLRTVVFGLLLATVAGIMGSTSGVSSTLAGAALADNSNNNQRDNPSYDNLRKSTGSLIYITSARGLLGITLLSTVAVTNMFTSATITYFPITGSVLAGIISGLGAIFLMWAYHKATDPAIAAVYYLTPVFAIGLLWAFTDVVLLRPDMFWLGVIAIIVGNIFLQYDPDAGATQQLSYTFFGFRSFVVALWAFGAFVALRDSVFSGVGLEWGISEYWGMIGVCATGFVLILSFRTNRLNERERQETNEFIYLHSHAVHYYTKTVPGLDTLELQEELRNLDRSRKMKDIARSYFRCHKIVRDAYDAAHSDSSLPPEETATLTKSLLDFQIRLDRLANERQTGRDFAELAALVSFAAITILLSLFAKPLPGVSVWASFVTEIAAVVFSATILFLCVNLIDRRRYRDSPTLREVSETSIRKYGQPPGWRLNFWVYDNLIPDRAVSSALGLAVMAAITIILGHKWF